MAASPGKVGIVSIEEVRGERIFALKFFQARSPAGTKRLLFAKYDAEATWLDDLKPASREKGVSSENEYRDISSRTRSSQGSSGQQC